MITLATLSQATAQQVFDQVTSHLLTQNEQSLSDSNSYCRYRGAEGRSCAAGCLIADSEYSPSMENATWKYMSDEGIVAQEHTELIYTLQAIHDTRASDQWSDALSKLAWHHKLDDSVVTNFKRKEA